MTFDLPGGRRLVLAGGEWAALWLAAGAAATVLLLVLYREERKLVSRQAGLGLLVLRLVAAAALVGALFEPIAERTFRENVKGRVVVAVDVSESMNTVDPGRTGEERAGLIKVLGLDAKVSLDQLTRREVARRLLDGPLAKVAAHHDVEPFTFARDTSAATTTAALAETLKRPAKPDDPTTQATDWQASLAEALTMRGGSKAPVVGVVLVTDGRRNATGDTTPTVDRLAAKGVPIFPILVGSTKAPRDAALASVKAPESVFKGDVATVAATLKLDGYAGQEVAVTLDRPGASPLRQVVHAPADGSRPTVTFRVPLEELGSVPLALAVGPLEGDARPDNDRRTVSVQVLDDKARVLLIDGEARWEFRYLRNALARDPHVAVDAIVFHQPRPGLSAVDTFTYGTALPLLSDESGAPDPLGSFDAIVVGDVDPNDAPAEFWARLDAYVAGRGGTLVIAPGPRSWSNLATIDAARKLIPVLEPRPAAFDPRTVNRVHPGLPTGLSVAPSDLALADAGSWPMLQLADDPVESLRRWSSLPPLPWALVGPAKPGATVLASATGDPTRAVIVAQPYGLGKVLWVGTDGTWRWRHRVGDAYHHRFWGQVVRWAATGKLAAGNAFVRFGPTRSRTNEGDPLLIQARISEGVTGVGPGALLAARVYLKGGSDSAVAVVPLRPSPGQPRMFEGVAPSLPPGSYVVRLDAPGLDASLQLTSSNPPPEAPLEVSPRDGSERVELSSSRDPLDRLATATHGLVLPDHDADRLPPLLDARQTASVRTEETALWDSPAALLLFFAVVTAEWLFRKSLGLP